jgi:protein-L-isoaspartate(D-aspartate) O-methyltransferase
MFEDSYRAVGKRKALIELLIKKGITDKDVLKAIAQIPRHLFLESAFFEHAYEDKAFSIGEGQTISQPYTVARQTELLELQKGDKVLEIGTGSGYQAAVLCAMGAEVYTVEYHATLSQNAQVLLQKLGYSPNCFVGDGSRGLAQYAPYDKIIVTAGAPAVPHDLIDQLKPGGILVIPVGDLEVQQMQRIRKTLNGELKKEIHGKYVFVPLKGSKGW